MVTVVDSMVSNPEDPLIGVLGANAPKLPEMKADVGISGHFACLKKLHTNQLVVAIAGIAGIKRIRSETGTLPLYRESSNL